MQSHLALAKLYLFQENLKLAEHELVTVLQTFPNDDNATLMLAELKFRSNDYVNAISHYKYILNRKPSEKMNVRYLMYVVVCCSYIVYKCFISRHCK